ncbi:MAG: hypothetical protein ACTTJ7_01960 [Treponema sp.]
MINTYNETDLHHTLKNLYTNDHAQQEVKIGNFVCDICIKDKKIIEIQTAVLSSLKKKLIRLLPIYEIEIVYPIIENAYILMLNADGTKRSYRKSPKHGSFFQIYRELYHLADILDQANLFFTILYVDCDIVKIDDKKGRSRYHRPRILNKRLLKIHKREYLHGLDSFTNRIMELLPDPFTSADLRKLGTKGHTSYVISFLKRTEKIMFYLKEGRYHVYKKCIKKH